MLSPLTALRGMWVRVCASARLMSPRRSSTLAMPVSNNATTRSGWVAPLDVTKLKFPPIPTLSLRARPLPITAPFGSDRTAGIGKDVACGDRLHSLGLYVDMGGDIDQPGTEESGLPGGDGHHKGEDSAADNNAEHRQDCLALTGNQVTKGNMEGQTKW